MDIRVGDVIEMKKKHPCGGRHFLVMRIGMDFRIRCLGCAHESLMPRAKCEKNIRKILSDDETRELERARK